MRMLIGSMALALLVGLTKQAAADTTLTGDMRILSPMDGAVMRRSDVEIRIALPLAVDKQVRSISYRIQGIRAIYRGVIVNPSSNADPAWNGEVRSLKLQIPQEDCVIHLHAELVNGPSLPAILHLRWGGAIRPVDARLRMLAIGISAYQDQTLNLRFAAKDAQDLAGLFQRQASTKLYSGVEVRVLTDRLATRSSILSEIEWLQRHSTADDVTVVFLAGHGINDAKTGRYRFLTYDTQRDDFASTSLDGADLHRALSLLQGRVLLFMDTCHSGNIMGPQPLRVATDLSVFSAALTSVQGGMVVYTASKAGQVSQESERWNNGAFTKALMEGLSGQADPDATGRVTTSTLDYYVGKRVRILTHNTQTPTSAKPNTLPDLEITRVQIPYKIHKKWWFWTTLGLVAAGGIAAAIGGSIIGSRSEPVPPLDAHIEF